MVLVPITFFLLGVGILLLSAQRFVKEAGWLSARLRLSPLIIGITIVALGTSLPELVVSILAAIRGDSGLAFGNIVGSNAVNLSLVLGLSILIGSLWVRGKKTQLDSWIMLGAVALFFLVNYLLHNWIGGGILLMSFLAIVWIEIRWGEQGRLNEDKEDIKHEQMTKQSGGFLLLFILLTGILSGGLLTVIGSEMLSSVFNLSETVFGLTATAIATSLPELLVSLMSMRAGKVKIALGNILGSNIYNLVFVGGILMFINPGIQMSLTTWIYLAGTTTFTVVLIFAFKDRMIPKWVGFSLLLLFLTYIWGVSS